MTSDTAWSHFAVCLVAITGVCYMVTIARDMGIDGKILATGMIIIAGIGGYDILTLIRSRKQYQNKSKGGSQGNGGNTNSTG